MLSGAHEGGVREHEGICGRLLLTLPADRGMIGECQRMG